MAPTPVATAGDAAAVTDAAPTPEPDRSDSLAWYYFLAAGLVFSVVYFLVSKKIAEVIVYDLLALATAVVIIVGARMYRPRNPVGWYLLAASQFLFFAGDLAFDIADLTVYKNVPFPFVSDAFYLSGYPFLVAALLILVRSQHPKGDQPSLIDGMIIAIGVAVLSWMFLMVPYANDPALTLPVRWTAIAYPLMDVVVLAVLARYLLMPSRRGPAYWMLAAGLLLTLVADAWYAAIEILGTYMRPHPVDALFLVAYTLIGAAALHPSMRAMSERGAAYDAGTSPWRLLLLGAAALVTPTVLAVQAARGETIEAPVIAGASAAIFVLVIIRLAGLMRDLARKYAMLAVQDAELQRTISELNRAYEDRQRILDQLVQVSEDERTRLAAEIHDGPVQRLTTLGFRLERERLRAEEAGYAEEVAALHDAEVEIAEEIRRLRLIMVELRPPVLAQRGLEAALRAQVEAFERQAGIPCRFDSDLHESVDRTVETVLYRVAQEGLTNIAKHARGATAEIGLYAGNGRVVLDIRDDGNGFDPQASEGRAQGHFGITGMRERVELAGGEFAIRSEPGAGTTIRVALPVKGLQVGEVTATTRAYPSTNDALEARVSTASQIRA